MRTDDDLVVQLSDIGRADGGRVGGKNASLGEMIGKLTSKPMNDEYRFQPFGPIQMSSLTGIPEAAFSPGCHRREHWEKRIGNQVVAGE